MYESEAALQENPAIDEGVAIVGTLVALGLIWWALRDLREPKIPGSSSSSKQTETAAPAVRGALSGVPTREELYREALEMRLRWQMRQRDAEMGVPEPVAYEPAAPSAVEELSGNARLLWEFGA